MSSVAVRLAEPADLDSVTRLTREMEAYYDGEVTLDFAGARARIEDALFGPRPIALAFLAEEGDKAIGVAFVTYLFPTWEFRPGLFIKDIFVQEAARNRGAGRAIIAAIARYAADRGYARIDWTAAADNKAASRLYRSLGAAEVDKAFFRLRMPGFGGLVD